MEKVVEREGIHHYIMDAGPMGPIGEGEALILRMTRNCPWNRCLFCPTYKGEKFSYRSIQEIKGDIDTVKRIVELLKSTSWELGFGGIINREVIQEVVRAHPEIYGRNPYHITHENYLALLSLDNVLNWFLHGSKRVFLQDADTLIMKPKELIESLKYLKKNFPTITTITSYARSRTCAQRSLEELKELNEAGLSSLFVGIESGCEEVLEYMEKGVNSKKHIEGGQKVMDAGIHLATFVMPGLAGKNRDLAEEHVLETIRVLNEIKPTEVRIRSLAILQDSPLYNRWESKEFEAPTDDQMIDEIAMILEGFSFECIIETLQMTNVLFNIRGKLSVRKGEMLSKVAWYKGLIPAERLRFRLNRYLEGGYLDCVESWGKLDSQLRQMIENAKVSLEKESPDAEDKTEEVIFTIKSKGIP